MNMNKKKIVFFALILCVLAVGLIVMLGRDKGASSQLAKAFSKDLYNFNYYQEPRAPKDKFVFYTLNHNSVVTMDDLAGRYVLLNFWATWCAPCVTELPSLEKLNLDMGDDLRVLAISMDRTTTRADIRTFMDRNNISMSVAGFYDDDRLARKALDVKNLPTTLLINPQGNVVFKAEGSAEWDSDAAKTFLNAIVN